MSTSTISNSTTALQRLTTGTLTTDNHYVGPSAVRFTSAVPLEAPPVSGSGEAAGTCSGLVDPFAIYVTSTIVVPETITLSDPLITPTPIYITPLPLCSKSANSNTFSNGGPGGDTGPIQTGPIDVASRSSTILVTKKTPVIILATPSPTPDIGGLAKTFHLVPAPAITTPTPTSVLAAIIQSIFDSPPSPTPDPAPASEQSPPAGAAGQPDTPPSATIINDVPIALFPSAVVIGTQTFPPPSQPTALIIAGQTFTLSPSQVIAPGGVILPLPAAPAPASGPPPLTTTIANLPLTLFASSAILPSATYVFAADSPPLTTLIAGQLLTIGPAGIIFPSTTLLLPTPNPLTTLTFPGLTIALSPSLAIISGLTLPLGPHAPSTVITIGGETLTAGPDGLVLPSTTIAPPTVAALPTTVPAPSPPPPPPTPLSALSLDGLLLSLAPSEVYLSGTGYAIGPGATPTTVVVGGETLVAGPGGVVLGGTTVGAPGETGTGTGGGGEVLGRAGGRRGEGWRVGMGAGVLVGVVWGLVLF
ncbi:hypothetical protein MMC15_001571 [Xylographa vitiligo]|nr:hypothetical protein [Xylographa vitiligo]